MVAADGQNWIFVEMGEVLSMSGWARGASAAKRELILEPLTVAGMLFQG